MEWIKQLFCFHRWDTGNNINILSSRGYVEYICYKCGKKEYYDRDDFPISAPQETKK